MAESVDGAKAGAKAGAKFDHSDEYFDPYCDLCYKVYGTNIEATGYCRNCFQFLCKKCNTVHDNLPASRDHVVLKGADMPQSQQEKPPKFDYCAVHPKHLNDQFCCEHSELVCSECSKLDHKTCLIESVAIVSQQLPPSEIDELNRTVNQIKGKLEAELQKSLSYIELLKAGRKDSLKDVSELYDQIIQKLNNMFEEQLEEIEEQYQSQISILKQNEARIKTAMSMLESSISEIQAFTGKFIDTKLFLKIQEVLDETNQYRDELNPLLSVRLTFVPAKEMIELLSSTSTIGSIRLEKSVTDIDLFIQKILFPCSKLSPVLPAVHPLLRPPGLQESQRPPGLQESQCSGQNSMWTDGTNSTGRFATLPKIRCRKLQEYNIKQRDDKYDCMITGIAITNDGRRLLVDNNNCKVKQFSRDMMLLCSLPVRVSPRDIAVISDKEAVVTTRGKSLIIIDISDDTMSIGSKQSLPYDVTAIAKYRAKLLITSTDAHLSSVKLIDKSGREYWSLSTDKHHRALFDWPRFVTCIANSNKVVVTDYVHNTLTIICGDTGDVIARRQVMRKNPRGVTTDANGNIYVCYSDTQEVAVLTSDVSVERILLTSRDGLCCLPHGIAYDHVHNELIVSGYFNDSVDYYNLSEI